MAPDIPKSKTKNENMLSEIDILSTTKINFMITKIKNDEAQKTDYFRVISFLRGLR